MNISNKQIWFFITSITFFATLMYIDFIIAKNNYLDEKNRDLTERYNSFISTRETLSNLIIEDIIQNQKTTKLLYDSIIDERNKNLYREELYSSLEEKYEYLKSKGFNIFHFHDIEGNSYLRFHKPEKFGDSLLDIRASIKRIIQEQKPIFGIETGVFIQVFRSIYPLFYEKEYVGSVEISSSFFQLINELNEKLDGDYTLLTKKDVLDNLLSESDKKREYLVSIFSDFYIYKNLREKGFSDINLEKYSSIINHKLQTEKSFSIASINLFSKSDIYSFLPITNIDGKFVGYLISKQQNKGINGIIATQFFTFLFLTLLLISGIIVYRKLQKRHDQNMQLFNQYQSVIDQSTIVSKTDPDGIITYANAQFCKVSGYSQDELIGNSHNIVRHKDSTVPFFRQMWKTLRAKKIWHGVIKNKKKNGDDYYVQSTIAPILNERNQIVEFIALREDITELMNKKNMLKNEKDRISTLFNYIDEILIIKKDDKFEQISQKFFNYFPYANLQEFSLEHNCICDLFIPQNGYLKKTDDDNWIQEILNNPNKIHKALMKDKNGIIRTFWVKIQKIPYEKSFYYLYSLIDITSLNSEESIEKVLVEEENKDYFEKTKETLQLPSDIVKSLVEKFVKSSKEGVIEFKKAIENEKIDEAKMIAHNIKGSAGTLKFDEIARLASKLELEINSLDFNEKIEIINEISIFLENLEKEVKKI